MAKQLLVPPFGEKVKLKDYDPEYTGKNNSEDEAESKQAKDLEKLRDLQEVFFADGRFSLLVVLQGMDTSGKDGAIEHVFHGVNPQGVQVASFKRPSEEELAHDYLWRVHQQTPRRGQIVVFNRSHYEDVLVVRVHSLVPKDVWRKRYDQINDFEQHLVENGTTILKFFLYISKDEQKQRLQARLDDPNKRWKFAVGDLKERELWDDYVDAYEDVLSKTNTESAPWHVVPANKKWYRNFVITRKIVETLEGMGLKYPEPKDDLTNIVIPD
jgi:PPK2 family polyphosphate:nucleotide phosphotransferase